MGDSSWVVWSSQNSNSTLQGQITTYTPYVVLADDGVKISTAERQRTAGWRVLNASS
jgi:hypothetical protein